MNNPVKYMLSYLQNHPVIGSIAPITGAFISSATAVMTSDATLKTIGIMSLYVGFFVGILTGIIKLIELFKLVKKK